MCVRYLVLLGLVCILGCTDPEPQCDPTEPSAIGVTAWAAAVASKQADEAKGNYWFWVEYGLPEWAWRNVPFEYRLYRIVNLRDRNGYYQGLGRWFYVTKEEAVATRMASYKGTWDGRELYTYALPEAARRVAALQVVEWLNGCGIICRQAKATTQNDQYKMYSLTQAAEWDPTCDHPFVRAGIPTGAEEPDAGGIALPPGTTPGESSTGGDYP